MTYITAQTDSIKLNPSVSLTPPNMENDTLFSRLYVFGDSLSDPGNIFNTTTAANAFPFLENLIDIDPPVPPYDSQGRITNGNPDDPSRSIWVDFLADALNLDGFAVPSTSLTVIPTPPPELVPPPDPSLAPAVVFNDDTSVFEANFAYGGQTANQSVNFAFGGAESGKGNVANPDPIAPKFPLPGVTIPGLNPNLPGVLKQIRTFINDVGDLPAEQTAELRGALYALWGGTNDFDPIATGADVDPKVPIDNVETAVKRLQRQVDARSFVILNMPDLGIRPFIDKPSVAQAFTTVTDEYNELLAQKLDQLRESFTDSALIPVDVYSLLQFAIANAADFGFLNTEDSYLDSSGSNDPDTYLFWDEEHPTRAAHQILGEFVYHTLQSASNSGDSVMVGDSEINVLIGGLGNDSIRGVSGNDLLLGSFGDDTLKGGASKDHLNGGNDDDILTGNSGKDWLNGSVGKDTLNGGRGNDVINGGAGNDWLEGNAGYDVLEGGLGRDTFIFSGDLLEGNRDVDRIEQFRGKDVLDFSGYQNAGGTLDFTRVSQTTLRVRLINASEGVEDIVKISGSQNALTMAEAQLTML